MLAVQEWVVPFESKMSPFVKELQDQTLRWVSRFHLVENIYISKALEIGRFNELTARCYPNAELPVLQIINDWMTWLFILDDRFDREKLGTNLADMLNYCDDLIVLLRQNENPHPCDPMFDSLLDLWGRTQLIAPSDWLKRFVDNMTFYFNACIWEAANRQIGTLPNLKDYVRERRRTGGVAVFISWSLITEKINLPVTYFDPPIFDKFFEIVGDVLCWTNDVVSLHREQASGDMHNLVMLIAHEYNLPMSTATEATITRINERIKDYLALEEPFLAEGINRNIHAYLGVLRTLMRGNFDWSVSTGRYQED